VIVVIVGAAGGAVADDDDDLVERNIHGDENIGKIAGHVVEITRHLQQQR